MISDYLFNRKQYGFYYNVQSHGENESCSVPQGSILGPLLFGLMINDFQQTLCTTNTIQYAADTVVYCAANNSKEIELLLNRDLRNIENWLDWNKHFINLKLGKTEYILYGSRKRLAKQPTVNIKIYDKAINYSKVYRYLGVYLDNLLNLQQHFEKVYKKASARVKLLSRIREQISTHVGESIYKTMIRPILMYCYQQQFGLLKEPLIS